MKKMIDMYEMEINLIGFVENDFIMANTVLQSLLEENIILNWELFDNTYTVNYLNRQDLELIVEMMEEYVECGFRYFNCKNKNQGILYF